MKRKLLIALAAISLALSSQPVPGADDSGASGELKDLIDKVQSKLKDGKKTEADLAGELQEFDALLAKHKDEKTDDVANILFMKAMLYFQVLDNTDKGVELVQQVKRDFPETKQGKNADAVLKSFKQQEESKKVQRALVAGGQVRDADAREVGGETRCEARSNNQSEGSGD